MKLPPAPSPRRPAALLGACVLLAAACDRPISRNPSPADAPTASNPTPAMAAAGAPDPDRRDVGRQVTAQASVVLGSNLVAAIGRTGPAGALEFCSLNVAPLTASVALPRAVALRRVTHRARNPENRASTHELHLIDAYREAFAAGRTNPPVLATNAAGLVTFYAPIVLNNPLCLQCHGEPGTDIAPATLAAIDRLYPADAARGFKLGEVRGLWSVSFP